MLLLTQSNLFLISRLPWLILFPQCQRLREMLYLCLKCVNYISGFMAFWTRLFPSKLEIQHIFSTFFNSVSRQHCEVWASQFPFLHSLKEVIPASEACLYGCINWSLAQAHSVALSQSFPPKRGCKARPWTGFQFTVHKRPMSGSVPGTSGASLPKWPHLGSGNEACPHGKKSAGGTVSTSSTESRRKGGHGGWHS